MADDPPNRGTMTVPVHPRKAEIVKAARQILAESGIQGVKTAAIAKRAGISEGGIYRHFSSLTDILLAVVDRIFEEISVLFVVPAGTSPMVHLRIVADRHSRLMADESRSFARPWLEIIATAPRMGLRTRAVEKQMEAAAVIAALVSEGQRAGEIRTDVDPKHIAWEFLSWAWGENVSSTIGLTDFIQHGHSSRMIHRILDDAAIRPSPEGITSEFDLDAEPAFAAPSRATARSCAEPQQVSGSRGKSRRTH